MSLVGFPGSKNKGVVGSSRPKPEKFECRFQSPSSPAQEGEPSAISIKTVSEPDAEVEPGADSDASASIRLPYSPSLPDDSSSSEADADSL